MTDNQSDRRKHHRYNVEQPCRVTVGRSMFGGKNDVKGLITDISMGGAAIRFGIQLENPPKVGTPINLYIAGIGDFPSKVLRRFVGGFAVAFRPRKTWDKQLVEKLEALLPEDRDVE